MKNYIKSDASGKGFFRRYLLFLVPLLVLAAISRRTDDTMPLLSSLASIAQSYLSILLNVAFFGYVIQFVTFRDKGFNFSGSVSEAAPKMLKWYLLIIVTLGIYSPWFIKNMVNYYLNRTGYEGETGALLSRPGTLLKYLLLTLYLPLIILICIFVFFMYRDFYQNGEFDWMNAVVPCFFFAVVLLLALVPFMYFYFFWLINIRFGQFGTVFVRSMRETAVFLIPQILLGIITLFIYYPAACVRIYRFFLEGSEYDNNEGARGGFGFDGTPLQGFLLMWGQGLLSLITAGIYGPWAMTKVTNWFLGNTFIEDKPVA